jgi:hypothetical protein
VRNFEQSSIVGKRAERQRRPLDNYETAPWQVDALVDNLPELVGSIWCPCVGDASLLDRLRERLPNLTLSIITNDIDPACDAMFHLDARLPRSWEIMVKTWGRPGWVVENPPFNVEIDILKCAWEVARSGVVFMSRVSFCEPTKDRGPWLSEHPYQKRITLERHSFTGNGSTDSATTDWLVWAKYPLRPPFGVSAYSYRRKDV